MKFSKPLQLRRSGYALMVVLVLSGLGLVVLAGAFRWSSASTALTGRNSNYFTAEAVAGSASEKVAARLSKDYFFSGPAYVDGQLSSYADLIPTGTETSLVNDYDFSNNAGVLNKISIAKISNWTFGTVQTRYSSIQGSNAVFRIECGARDHRSARNPLVRVQRDVKLASAPLFGFGVFYASDLEVNPTIDMSFSGRLHCNGNFFCAAIGNVDLLNDVTSARQIFYTAHPLDPTSRPTRGTLRFSARNDSNVNPWLLPIGTNNTPLLLRAILDMPPAAESSSSTLGKQRFYNKADLIILVSNGVSFARCGGTTVPWTNVCDMVVTNAGPTNTYWVTNITGPGNSSAGNGKAKGKGGNGNNFVTNIVAYSSSTGIQTNILERLISTNGSFFEKRENKTVQLTEVDINYLRTNTYFRSILGRDVSSIYLGDFRTNSGNIFGVRLVAGQTLPSLGLTVASPNPLYIDGDYNVPTANLGTTNTSGTLPSAILADAITILSVNWRDTNSSASITNCIAANTTINTALAMGVVPTGGGYYSGGLERSIRMLEDWSNKTFTLNGSIVVLYYSQIANQPDTANAQVYKAPLRRWSFDRNFSDPAKLPPGTPWVRSTLASSWKTRP